MTLEIYHDPVMMVDDFSTLGLRHVGFAVPTELFGPFVSACVEALGKNGCGDKATAPCSVAAVPTCAPVYCCGLPSARSAAAPCTAPALEAFLQMVLDYCRRVAYLHDYRRSP